MKNLWVCLLAVVFSTVAEAQTFSRYIIRFTNKATTPFALSNPGAYLSPRALERRLRYKLAIDSADLPVPPSYLDSIRLAGNVTLLNASKWLNQVSIETTDAAALQKIASFPFVQVFAPVAARMGGSDGAGRQRVDQLSAATAVATETFNYGQSFAQVRLHNGDFLHNLGLRGQNMIIGMLDAGYFNYTGLRAFDSVRAAGQVLGTWDFVAREASVTEDDPHGMQCFSVIAANLPGQFVGAAPKASFYLFRSEDVRTEYPIEEHNWVCAAERLDSAGGDVISSSLGYASGMSNPVFNHTYAEMNGNTTIAARGADIAAAKGILVVNAAGNDGNNPFRFISSPADGDSVLAVGAVTVAGVPAGFSSYGPSADGQVKPDVASVGVGTTVQTTANTIGGGNGTSFACPNIAGLATCLWQGFRDATNMQIIEVLRKASSQAATPNDRVGYGIPDMRKAVQLLLAGFSKASATTVNCRRQLSWTSKDVSGMRYEIERMTGGENVFRKIGEVAGTGSVFGNRSYQYTDNENGSTGTTLYRIRHVIDTASQTAYYIDTVQLASDAGCMAGSAAPVVVAPNPIKNRIVVRITTPAAVERLSIRLFDGNGKLLAVERRSKGAGLASFDLPAGQLAAGKYYLWVFDGEQKIGTAEVLKL